MDNKQALTKANFDGEKRVSITASEAMEYREYKRQRKRAEILSAIANCEGILTGFADEKRVREHAMRLRQAAVYMTPERLEMFGQSFVNSAVAVDCVIGGNGETLSKVKAYEARKAARLKARELTLTLSPYAVENCRYEAIRKEIKAVRRAAPKVALKVRVEKEYPSAVLSRLARLCAELGAAYFCVPYFEGCERIRLEMKNGCKLQVFGVEHLSVLKKMHGAGVERVVTTQAWEMFSEWMKEVEKINFPELMPKAETALQNKKTEQEKPIVTALRLPFPSFEPKKLIEACKKSAENEIESCVKREA